MTVLVVDYGAGNLGSATRALEECGGDVLVSADSRQSDSQGAVETRIVRIVLYAPFQQLHRLPTGGDRLLGLLKKFVQETLHQDLGSDADLDLHPVSDIICEPVECL